MRQIDHGRNIRLETKRNEVRLLHTKSIKDLDGIEAGIAQFEKVHREYVDAGGGRIRKEGRFTIHTTEHNERACPMDGS